MRATVALAAALVLLVLLALVARSRAPSSTAVTSGDVAGPAASSRASDDETRAADGAAARAAQREHALGTLAPGDAWRRQVAAALGGVAAGLGRRLTPDAEARLLDALATVRPAAQGLDRETLDPDDPASIARVRERTAALVSADQVCRAELGIGVAELLRALDPHQIDDRGGSAPTG